MLIYQGSTAKSDFTKRKLPAIPRGPFAYTHVAALEVAADFHVVFWLISSDFLLFSQIQLLLSHICNFPVLFCYLLFFFCHFGVITVKLVLGTFFFVLCIFHWFLEFFVFLILKTYIIVKKQLFYNILHCFLLKNILFCC